MKLFRGQPDHDHWKKPFNALERARFWWGLGAVSVALGLSYQTSGSPTPPFTGKWGWVNSLIYNTLGPTGFPIAMYVAGALMACVGLSIWLASKTHGNEGSAR